MTYKLVQTEGSLSVRSRCRVATVSPSAYYAWQGQKGVANTSDAWFLELIKAILVEFPGYGYRRVTKELQRQGYRVNKKRIQRLMQEHHLGRKKRRRFVRTTDSEHHLPVYPNLVKEVTVTGPDQVWAADITYVRLLRGFVYLAVILDLFSRKVIGWALSRSLHARLAINALQMAVSTRDVNPGLIHHSDQGIQYASSEYVRLLQEHGIQISMSRKGNPYDNATAESFISTLKAEEVSINEYTTAREAYQNIGTFIEEVYNRKRLHSSLGYRPPEEFEQMYHSHNEAA